MTYTVKEIFYTLQGEGARTGRAAVFCRFAGCNLWSGREEDRARAVCQFCDTDFIGTGPDGGKFSGATELADAIDRCWGGHVESLKGVARQSSRARRDNQTTKSSTARKSRGAGKAREERNRTETPKYVVCTGGEPLLQLDEALIDALHARGFEVAVETNGTKAAPAALDWICVSPKAGAPFVQTSGSELKLVFPQVGAPPEAFAELAFKHFFLQPMDDGPATARNTELAIDYCLRHPSWRLSIQTHKLLGLR
jgi:7-carboxy-7-deazaguanine synthase